MGGVDADGRARGGRPSACELGPLVACAGFHPPAADREDGGDDRRDQRRALRARARRGLEPARVRRVRHPVRPARVALRGGVRDHPRPAGRGAGDARRRRSTRPTTPCCCPSRRAGAADDRLQRPAHAARSRCRTSTRGTRGRTTTATRPRASRSCSQRRSRVRRLARAAPACSCALDGAGRTRRRAMPARAGGAALAARIGSWARPAPTR